MRMRWRERKGTDTERIGGAMVQGRGWRGEWENERVGEEGMGLRRTIGGTCHRGRLRIGGDVSYELCGGIRGGAKARRREM